MRRWFQLRAAWLALGPSLLLFACKVSPSKEPTDTADSGVAPPCDLPECNGEDDDCDGLIDEPSEPPRAVFYADRDGDGYGDPMQSTAACVAPAGMVANGDDCDDRDPQRHPFAWDSVGDSIDQDCDGSDALCTSVPRHAWEGDRTFRGSDADAQAAEFCDAYDGVAGRVVIDHTPWQDLSSLRCLCSADALEITDNPVLDNLTGLPEGRRFGGDVTIRGNPLLTTLAGLARTTWSFPATATSQLVIRENLQLTDSSGFDGWTTLDLLQVRDNPELVELQGMPQLEVVLSSLEVRDNASLSSISAFSSLQHVAELRIEDNPRLTTIAGLSSLRSVHDFILGATPLIDLSGLSALSAMSGQWTVRRQDAPFSWHGLPTLLLLGGLTLVDNPGIVSLAGFPAVSGLQGDLVVARNASLLSLEGLESIEWVDGSVVLGAENEDSPLRSVAGLNNLRVVSQTLYLFQLPQLRDLRGLEALEMVGGISVDGTNRPTPALFSLRGLSSLVQVTGRLTLQRHPSITDLRGLDNLSQVEDIYILDNPALQSFDGLDRLETARTLVALRNGSLSDISSLNDIQSIASLCIELPGDTEQVAQLLASTGASEVCP